MHRDVHSPPSPLRNLVSARAVSAFCISTVMTFRDLPRGPIAWALCGKVKPKVQIF
jgi:hypothetical protein